MLLAPLVADMQFDVEHCDRAIEQDTRPKLGEARRKVPDSDGRVHAHVCAGRCRHAFVGATRVLDWSAPGAAFRRLRVHFEDRMGGWAESDTHVVPCR